MITTDYKYNFTKAENETFTWDSFLDDGGLLHHKASGRDIYQMHWIGANGRMAESVEGETREQVLAFWNELSNLQKQKPPRRDEPEIDPEPKHGVNGYCRKCHSYCYGDCEAN